MPVALFTGGFYTAQDASGVPISGAEWYFYEAGAYSTPKDTYTDYALTTPSANPVVADAAGRFAAIYLDGSYAGVLKDADGVTIKSILNINNENDSTANALTTVNIQSGTGYTLQLSDANGKVVMTNASANTVTVPPASSVAWDTGTSVVIEQGGAGQTTIVAGSGVTVDTAGSLVIDRQHANVAVTNNAADDWTITGQFEGGLLNSGYESDITAIESDLVIITSDITAIESDLVIIASDIAALEAGGGGILSVGGDTSASGSDTDGSVDAVTIASVAVTSGSTLVATASVDAYSSYSGSGGLTTVKILHNGTAIATWTNPGYALIAGSTYGAPSVTLTAKSTTVATGSLVLQVNGAASPYTIGYTNAFMTYIVVE